jgi:beta-galactosidase
MGMERPAHALTRQRIGLNGEWELAFDHANKGLAEGWPGHGWPAAQADRVSLPALWDVTHPGFEGVGFYRRTFEAPAAWADKALVLKFEGVAYRAEAWVNGQYAGSHEGAYTPFSFDITQLARAGEVNSLVVRVAGLSRAWPVDGQVLEQAPASKQNWYFPLGGIWGEVSVEACPWVSIEALRVAPDLQREIAEVEIVVRNRRAEHRMVDVRLAVRGPDDALAAEAGSKVAAPPGVVQFAYRVALPRPWPWHYDTPQRYRLQAEVQEGPEAADRDETYFGMRDFTVQGGQFMLNGAPVYVRGILLQPHYPVGLIMPPDPEMMRREIVLMKQAGFNMIRTHLRPPPPGFLNLADEMGMLVYEESSLAWIRESPRMLDHCKREVQAMIERDFNHPSVVIWGIFNENPPAAERFGEPLLRQARGLDATRVVVDNSGGALAIDQNFGWIDRAHVVANRDTVHQEMHDIHLYLGDYLPGPLYEWLRTVGSGAPSDTMAHQDFGTPQVFAEFDRELRGYPGKIFVSELGCGGMMDLDAALAGFGTATDLRDAREFAAFRDSLHEGFAARGLEALFGTPAGLAQAAQQQQAAGVTSQLEALLCNPRISGYVLTQLNDLAWEFHGGILDAWRNPKPAYQASQRLNQPHVVVLRADSLAARAGDELRICLTLVSSLPLPAGARVTASVRTATGEDLVLGQQAAPSPAGVHPLPTLALPMAETGRYHVVARLETGGEAIAEASQTLLGVAAVNWRDVPAVLAWRGTKPPVAGQIGESGPIGQGGLLVAPQPASLLEDDWDALLEAVKGGQTAVIGPLHSRDDLALRRLNRYGLNLHLHFGIGSWMGCYHWQPRSALFEGLPAGGLAERSYVDVLPWYAMSEIGGQVLAGSLRNTQSNLQAPAMVWYSDIEAVPLGAGRVIFCQYRIFDRAHNDPIAGRMLANLLQWAAAGA